MTRFWEGLVQNWHINGHFTPSIVPAVVCLFSPSEREGRNDTSVIIQGQSNGAKTRNLVCVMRICGQGSPGIVLKSVSSLRLPEMGRALRNLGFCLFASAICNMLARLGLPCLRLPSSSPHCYCVLAWSFSRPTLHALISLIPSLSQGP